MHRAAHVPPSALNFRCKRTLHHKVFDEAVEDGAIVVPFHAQLHVGTKGGGHGIYGKWSQHSPPLEKFACKESLPPASMPTRCTTLACLHKVTGGFGGLLGPQLHVEISHGGMQHHLRQGGGRRKEGQAAARAGPAAAAAAAAGGSGFAEQQEAHRRTPCPLWVAPAHTLATLGRQQAAGAERSDGIIRSRSPERCAMLERCAQSRNNVHGPGGRNSLSRTVGAGQCKLGKPLLHPKAPAISCGILSWCATWRARRLPRCW